MNVSLTPRLEKLVQAKVAAGLHNSASEVVREALRLLEERDRLLEVKLAALRREISVGLDQLERGDASDYDDRSLKKLAKDVKARGRKQLATGRKQGATVRKQGAENRTQRAAPPSKKKKRRA